MLIALFGLQMIAGNVYGNSIQSVVHQIFLAYKDKRFKEVIPFSTGKMKTVFEEIDSQYRNGIGKLPQSVLEFGKLLDSYKIINEYKEKKRAVASILWIQEGNRTNTLKRILSVEYLFVKKGEKWYVEDSRFVQEYTLYSHSK